MRILISPDKFKGTLTAPAAALAIAEGVRLTHPTSALVLCPVADGGEGTLGTLLDAVGGTRRFVSAADPWGDRTRVPVGMLDDGTICFESAAPRYGDPTRADSYGIGVVLAELIATAAGSRVLIGIGGTASTDGGTGMARALGWRFLDRAGDVLAPGGTSLVDLDRIVGPAAAVPIEVTALCDVDAPLTGERGSARVFAAQKGASPDDVILLERGLERLAEVVHADLGIDLEGVVGAGAGGGIAAGIIAFCGGDAVSGFDRVAASLRLRSRINAADLVITGEGGFDEQSLQGKATVGVARLSHDEGIPCLGVFGHMSVPATDALRVGFSDVLTIRDQPPAVVEAADAAQHLTRAAAALMARQPM